MANELNQTNDYAAYRAQIDALRETTNGINAALRGPAYGITQIDDKPATSLRFERSDVEGRAAFTVSFHMGNKAVAKLKDLNADALDEAVGEKNAKTITEHQDGKGTLKGEDLQNEYGLSPEESARRTQMKETRKQAETIFAEGLEPDAADEKNIVEPVPEKELPMLDGAEIVARANLLRQREREQLSREQERLGLSAEGKRIDVENLSEKAVEQDDANDNADRTGAAMDRPSQQFTEREKNRQVELMEQVHGQFRVSGAKFHFKDQPGKLAFKDKGERMVSASNDDRVAKAMATMAEAKGWKTIKVSGHPDFQREVWMEGSLRGLQVRGFKPNEQDLKTLEDRRESTLRNTVERDVSARESTAGPQQRLGADRNAPAQRQERAQETGTALGKASAPQRAEKGADTALRAFSGRLLKHGVANYNHDPMEKQNYFVKVATEAGEKTVWGVDLKRALSVSKAKTGDDVKLEFKGKQLVTVEALKRDKAGKVIGAEQIDTHRNTWEVEKSDKHKVVEAFAATFIDANIKDPAQRETLKAAIDARLVERAKAGKVPAVPMYDIKTPTHSKQPERIAPQVERKAERTR
jgi:Large polyvalent protein-associated domain 7